MLPSPSEREELMYLEVIDSFGTIGCNAEKICNRGITKYESLKCTLRKLVLYNQRRLKQRRQKM